MITVVLGLNTLLLVSLFVNIFGTMGTFYYAWKIWRMKVTPEWTWSFKVTAAALHLIGIFYSVGFIWQINSFIATFPSSTLVISFFRGGLETMCIFAFVYRVYVTLNAKFPKELLNSRHQI